MRRKEATAGVRNRANGGQIGDVQCVELAGKTLRIVCFGLIGRVLVRMAKAVPMPIVIVTCSSNIAEILAAGADPAFSTSRLLEELALADFVILVLR